MPTPSHRQGEVQQDRLALERLLDRRELSSFLVSRTGGGGLTYGESRNEFFTSPARGVRIPEHTKDDLVAVCEGLQLLLPEESAFVCTTAALLHGIPLPPWMIPERFFATGVQHPLGSQSARQRVEDSPIEVAYPPPVPRRQIDGIRHRQWRVDPSGSSLVGGLRVTSPARTWFDLAALIPADYLLAAADHIVRLALADPSDLRRVIRWAGRRRGVRNARTIVELINPAAESPPESRVRYWLKQHGLPDPEVNTEIVVEGEWLARGDLVFRERRVVIEYDGAVHLTEERRRYDAKRRNLLQEHGWLVVVLTADDLAKPYEMSRTVRAALECPNRTATTATRRLR